MTGELFVVEGPDSRSNSSITRALAKEFGAKLLNRPSGYRKKPKDMPEEEHYQNLFDHYCCLLDGALDFDHVVTAYFGYLFPAKTFAYEGKRIPPLQGNLTVIPDYIIYVKAEFDELRKRIVQVQEKGGQLPSHETNAELFSRFCERYDELLMAEPGIITIDNTGKTIDNVMEELMPQLDDVAASEI